MASRLLRAHSTATESISAACNSARGNRRARAAPTAPEPQHKSTTTPSKNAFPRGPRTAAAVSDGEAPGTAPRDKLPSPDISSAASHTNNSVRRLGTKTPGRTAMRWPSNSAQHRMYSSGTPATRRRTQSANSAGLAACSRRRSDSSSANTQPAARRASATSTTPIPNCFGVPEDGTGCNVRPFGMSAGTGGCPALGDWAARERTRDNKFTHRVALHLTGWKFHRN